MTTVEFRSQESGVRSQKSGVAESRRQKAEGRRQESYRIRLYNMLCL
ncbi:MAG: hypothetical protein F6K18_23850 [Okeania sp. SIO2C2]|nr:hypothetical protein [Okeania sp. SIO2C2]NEP89622.1 hypothetical protein [Okeania sp. SIO2C2]